MAEYIEREKAYEKCGWYNTVNGKSICAARKDELAAIPAADVAPVVHGRWDDSGQYTFPDGSTAVRCTNCGCALTESEYRLNNWNYCPVCGAKMEVDHEDD